MIGQLKPTGEGAGQQFPGWIIRLPERRFEIKGYEVIGIAKLAHRKSRWKLRKIIAQLKSSSKGTWGNNCCWKNRCRSGICWSLHMTVIACRNLPSVS